MRAGRQSDHRVRVGRTADVLRAPNHLTVIARRIRLNQDRRTGRSDFRWRWQALRAALRGPHPCALIIAEGWAANLAYHDRAVDVGRSRIPDEAIGARYQFLAAVQPARTRAKSRGVLITDDDMAVAGHT